MNRIAAILVFCGLLTAPSKSFAEPIPLEISTPLGLVGNPDGNFRNVTIDNRGITRIEFRSVDSLASYEHDVPGEVFRANWAADGWSKISYREFEATISKSFDVTFDFNVFQTLGGTDSSAGVTHYLPPIEDGYYATVYGPNCHVETCVGSFVLEFSVESIPAPIVGDVDVDDDVDFVDFLILSAGFGVDWQSATPRWDKGDANLSGNTNFPDFLLFREHFGETRATEELVPVPEPIGRWLGIAGVAIAITLCRRRRVPSIRSMI